MPHLDYTGPDGDGPKTGRKLGKCKKTEQDVKETVEIGKGLAKHRHSDKSSGKGKRIKYYQSK